MLLVAERLNLKMASDYKCLSQSGCLAIDGVDDARKFHMLVVIIEIAITNCQEKRDGCCNHHAAVNAPRFLVYCFYPLFSSFSHPPRKHLILFEFVRKIKNRCFQCWLLCYGLGTYHFK